MTEHERAQCPVCGSADSTFNLRTWRAEQELRMAEAREAAARQAGALATGSSAGGGSGSGSGLGPLPEMGEEALLGLAGIGLRAAWRKLVSDPLRDRALPALAGRQEEIIQRFSSAINRHPDLWVCPLDNVVFREGGVKTVPAGDAMRWLRDGDDAKLDATLYQN
jgi:hypothetical protein